MTKPLPGSRKKGFLYILHEVAFLCALIKKGGNITHAAEYLGIGYRTASDWRRRYRIEVRQTREGTEILCKGKRVEWISYFG